MFNNTLQSNENAVSIFGNENFIRKMENKNIEKMTIGGGCFWCTEAVFKEIKGVEKVVSGYSGGSVPGTPTYREVCSGLTGHAEVVQISFNPKIISCEDFITVKIEFLVQTMPDSV